MSQRLRRAPNKNLPASRRVSARDGKRSPVPLAAAWRELDKLRLTVQDIRRELSALQLQRPISTENDKLKKLCEAIHEIHGSAPFAASWIFESAFESADERDSSASRLRQALRDAIGPRKKCPSLSRLLKASVGVVGPWFIEIMRLETRDGRLFRVSNVSNLLTNQQTPKAML